ncbi:MAG TPA: protein phosphatase CheZ [Salinarimonas sp.]|nr:protein phosphatase CheZ [Salinarimonas sp.]
MAAFADLKLLIQPATEVSQAILEEQRRDLREAQRLKDELDAISAAIQRTKQEIATLHFAGAQGREMGRVTDELGAVVLGTEDATNLILESAEAIDDLAANLSARLSGEEGALAAEIGERVVAVFEACNFQDITGQRISKVVNAMRFVEERVNRMIEIWGGLESFQEVEVLPDANRAGERALLNGPALDEDEGVTSQNDIDALFG